VNTDLAARLPGPPKTDRRKTTANEPKTMACVVWWSRKATNVNATDASNPVLHIKRIALEYGAGTMTCVIAGSDLETSRRAGSRNAKSPWGAAASARFLLGE
jgi:hypothetical protein